MAASAPVEVGAQGTIGSLVCREVEYFRRMEVAVVSHDHGKNMSSSSKQASRRRHRQRGEPQDQEQGPAAVEGGRGRRAYLFLPSICSSAEVAEATGAARVRPFASYQIRSGEEQNVRGQNCVMTCVPSGRITTLIIEVDYLVLRKDY
uniref:Uncharacterized protein n=1 Tax=Oryza sativa subsp. japonica TaxID=39947 RepID=Q94LC4_ORYSJ|nr:hypothetical protein [Oryza sativa Japonica Group]